MEEEIDKAKTKLHPKVGDSKNQDIEGMFSKLTSGNKDNDNKEGSLHIRSNEGMKRIQELSKNIIGGDGLRPAIKKEKKNEEEE